MIKQATFYKKRIYPLLFMFLVTVICILITSGLFLSTQERATANELSFTRRAILDAGGLEYTPTTEGIEKTYKEKIQVEDGGSYYTAETAEGKRYILPMQGPGLWGTIAIMVGLEEDLTTFSGLAIVSQNETPGLGGRIEEPWFTQQFQGKKSPFTLVNEGTADAPNEVDAITGATRTSEYFRNLTNRASTDAKRIIRGE